MQYDSTTYNKRGGFTLIEILIVSGITVILGFFTTTTVYGWREHKTLSVTAEQMATLLREAVSSASQQREGARWGVEFNNSGEVPFYRLFREDSLGSRTPAGHYRLPPSVRYDLQSNEVRECIFAQISGQVADTTACNQVKILLIQNPGASSTIQVSEAGAVAYTTYSCSLLGCSPIGVTLPPPPPGLGGEAPPGRLQQGGGPRR